MAAVPPKDDASNPIRPGNPLKAGLHPRNQHRGQYDFDLLIAASPPLAGFVKLNAYQNRSIDFANAAAVKALNQALLLQYYAISDWDIPPGYLCPPIPGRADYLHYLADLLRADLADCSPNTSLKHPNIHVLDIGTGANLIYPLLGHREYGWQFVGADIDPAALQNAQRIVDNNGLAQAISLRLQTQPDRIFQGLIQPEDRFAFTMCNPPFHATPEDASAATRRKLQGLKANQVRQLSVGISKSNLAMPDQFIIKKKSKDQASMAMQRKHVLTLNFGGQSAELYCDGGELGFIRRMISESTHYSRQCLWFTTLVSQAIHLPAIYRELKHVRATQIKTIDMAQGQKKSRIVAWTFLTPSEHKAEFWA